MGNIKECKRGANLASPSSREARLARQVFLPKLDAQMRLVHNILSMLGQKRQIDESKERAKEEEEVGCL